MINKVEGDTVIHRLDGSESLLIENDSIGGEFLKIALLMSIDIRDRFSASS